MCLAVPGKIVSIGAGESTGVRLGTIDFQGNRAEVNLVLTPEATAGDWVLVHAGFAIQTLNEEDALETWKYLEQCVPDTSPPDGGLIEP
jgi:hydrogenase expression/formation protein HypC